MRILRILILPLVTCLVSGQLTRMMKRFFVSMNDRISPEFNDEVTSLREEQRGMPDQQRLTLRASQFDRIDDSIKESIRTTAETEEDNSFAGFPFYDQSTEPDDSEDDEFDQIGNNLGHPDPIEDITIPKDDEDEIFQSPIAVPSDHMFSLKIIPNLTTRKDLFNEMTSAALRNRQAVKFGFPIKELINATLNKGPFPTLVPHQTQQFPSLERDIFCNPSLMANGCSTLAEWGRAFGVPLRNILINSQLGALGQRIGGTANLLHEKLTRGLTPAMIDFLEMDGHVKQIEAIAESLSSLFVYDRSRDKVPSIVSNLSSLLIFDNGLVADRDTVLNTFSNVMKDKVKAALLCRISNGRLPNCDSLPNSSSSMVSFLPSEGPVNDLGFYEYIAVNGFASGCSIYRGCTSGSVDVEGFLFDGIYFFADVDQFSGYPIYWRPVVSDDFRNVHSMILWQGSFKGPNTELISQDGLYAAITPNQPNFDYAMFGSRAPFAFRAGATGPDSCQQDVTNFPHCLTHDNHWVLSRYSSASCSGFVHNSRACQWRIPHIHFYGTNISIDTEE